MGHQPWQRRALLAIIAVFAFALISASLIPSLHWLDKPFPGFFLHENLTVGPYFLPQWSGAVAGLRSLDRVVAVNGISLRQRGDLYQAVRNAPPGTRFRYTVSRSSQSIDLIVPSMTFKFHDWFLSFGVYVVMGLAFLIIGVAPYYFRANSPAALPLCFMVLAVFVWFESTFDFMTNSLLPKELRIFGLTLTPSAGIHLALLLRTGRPLRRSHPVYLFLIYACSLALGWLISLTFFGAPEIWIVAFRLGYLYACVGALAFLAIIGSALRGVLPDLDRSRLRVMLVGAVLGFFLPTLGTVLTSSFRLPIPYNLALVPTIFFPLSVTYALLKYSLFDLGNALKIGLSRIALTAFLLVTYVVVIVLLGPRIGLYEKDPLTPLFFSVLVVLFFNPLLRWIEGVVNRYVFRQDYDPVEVQKEVSLFLRSLATAEELANGFLARISEHVGVQSAALAYRAKQARESIVSAINQEATAVATAAPLIDSLWEEKAGAHFQGLSRGEVSTHPRYRERRAAMLEVFDRLSAELIIPIVFERQVCGFVAFGSKRSRKEYSADDLRLLATLTDQLALSLENGRLYQESVAAYNQAEASNQRLREMDRVKKDFVSNICHELRTPVSTIIGYSEVLLESDIRGNARGILERVVHNGQELSQLMDSLMNFSKLESETVLSQLEVVDLTELLGGLEIMARRLIRDRPIAFNKNLDDAARLIQSDAQKLQQILVQLLTNAVKFTEQGKIELSARTLPSADSGFLEIALADTGIGIKAEDQELIFEEFRQLDGSSTRHYGGTGLGLNLCKKLAQSLGGTIQVSSEFGVGSVFRLLLPLPSPLSSMLNPGAAQVARGLH